MCDTVAIADRHGNSVTEPKRDTVAVTDLFAGFGAHRGWYIRGR
jgi:hypothetical protein